MARYSFEQRIEKYKAYKSLEKQYFKEINRINKLIKKYQDKGFIISNISIPKQPKTITEKSVERLKSYDEKKISKFARLKYGNKTLKIETAKERNLISPVLLKPTKKFTEYQSKYYKPINVKPVKKEEINWRDYFTDEDDIDRAKRWYKEGKEKGIEYTPRDISSMLEGYHSRENEDIYDTTDYEYKPLNELPEETYSPQEWEEILKEYDNGLSYQELPSVQDKYMNVIKDLADYLTSVQGDYTTYIDEAITQWTAGEIKVIGRGGNIRTIYVAKNPGNRLKEIIDEKRQDKDKLIAILNKVKQEVDPKILVERIDRNKDRLDFLMDVIMYLAYQEEAVSQALTEFGNILTDNSLDENKELNDSYNE